MKEDIYIRLLKEAKSDLDNNVTMTRDEFRRKLEDKNIRVPEYDTYCSIYRNTSTNSIPCFMNIEAYFKLLEYEELQEARKSSRQAKVIAIFSILLTAIAILVQIFLN
ncbi:hypothetical protein LVD17_00030 [Fulvivirga ulvae]|uniref:hypothetical protein n=1 Tax=Fulvivirga ulvae TaxID=2904245 RepID=UPI001F331800|nr:hypothetical protein [Fulvivirga ulvae]UII32191.1 hypothetical protein LVD17_28300 [Fulvivirga ulvae]UII32223.1 hypothetical protein LVD17_00030 [Fulvivirga ulvae]